MLFGPPSTKLLHRLSQFFRASSTKTSPTARRLDGSTARHQAAEPSLPGTLAPSHSSTLARLASLGFLLLFTLTPLIFTPLTSELFEFPKMVFVYAIAIYELAIFALRIYLTRTLVLPKTILTKPILMYLAAFLLTTIFSVNLYTSIAGYYTRFNGGLTSLLAYLVLFYLFLIHVTEEGRRATGDGRELVEAEHTDPSMPSCSTSWGIVPSAQRNLWFLWAWLFSATIVSIYAIFEHFGHDPSCLILRHTFTANCWVQDVQARVFATFGQPNWLATYLVATIPLGLALLLQATTIRAKTLAWLATFLSYTAFWYTYSRSAWFGLIAALGAFIVIVLINNRQKLAWPHFSNTSASRQVGKSAKDSKSQALADLPTCSDHIRASKLVYSRNFQFLPPLLLACLLVSLSSFHMAASRSATTLESGGEDSSTGQIRLLVWQGSLNLIKDHPILGTGPQTFAYTFLPYRPRAMNDTTEWNFLYNEAHNQLLNQLATTGLIGTIPWLALFVYAILLALNLTPADIFGYLRPKSRQSGVESRLSLPEQPDQTLPTPYAIQPTAIPAALAAGIAGVFTSQLFGFSVVATDLLFWLALAYLAAPTAKVQIFNLKKLEMRNTKHETNPKSKIQNPFFNFQTSDLFRVSNFVFLIFFIILLPATYGLLAYTSAELLATQASANLALGDISTALRQYQQAVNFNPFEPTYHQDLAYAYAYIASFSQSTAKTASAQANQQAQQAYHLAPGDQIITKELLSTYQALARIDPRYNQQALFMAQHSLNLAPTDAASAQALGDLQLNLGQKAAALKTYQTLLRLRPDAGDSYYHLALYYAKYGPRDQELKALHQALHLDLNNQPAQDLLNSATISATTLPGND